MNITREAHNEKILRRQIIKHFLDRLITYEETVNKAARIAVLGPIEYLNLKRAIGYMPAVFCGVELYPSYDPILTIAFGQKKA